ncbi:MAG: hypothetical protein IV093_13990 [Rubrivivax sp.]|nr:hypothetical protein [Rubrivivax sp.]
MNQPSSASSAVAARWDYIRTGPGRSGRSLSENNFAKERRDWLSILLREILQNALDARVPASAPVVVSVQHRELDTEARTFVEGLITPEHHERFKKSVPHVHAGQASTVSTCLVVEDFGTSGLTGVTNKPDLDGKGQNWNAFWFREGEGGKENTSGNGGAGQGKITYFSTSGIRTIFAYTVRADDQSEALFGASSFLRDYEHDGHKWKRDAYWGVAQGEGVDRIHLPVHSAGPIASFRQHFGITRQAGNTGLSLIIPSPKDIRMADAVQITIAEFFVPILRGDLVVTLGETTLEKSSIVAIADQLLSNDRAHELHTCTTKGYRTFLAEAIGRSEKSSVIQSKPFTNASQISDASFDAADLQAMRDALEEEEMVSVRFPVQVKPKDAAAAECYFDVHLACPFELDRPEQAVIRRDLLIGEEPVGAGKLRQRARGLILINDKELSRLLLSAEEATHLRWNTRLPRLGEYYRSGPEVVAIVRNAMVRLLDVLTGGDQKRDFKLLSKYFSAPGSFSAVKAKGKKSQKGRAVPIPGQIPPPQAKLLAIESLADGCRIRPAKADALGSAKLPIEVSVEFAYEGLDKDAFNEYDPLDFDLADKAFSITVNGCIIKEQTMNRLGFVVEKPDFDFRLTGFDKNLRLRIRLNYKEATDAATFDAQ